MVTLEYAGYGLSEDSKKKRTNETIVEEIRSTLKQLEIKPPYILVPHSISGVYCLSYMNSYPEEVEAMIGIDASVPNQSKYEDASKIPEILYYGAKFLDVTGLTRLFNLSGTEYLQDMEASGSYSKEDMKNVSALYYRKSVTRALLNESRSFKDNCKELYDVKCPDHIPVLYLLSSSSCKQYKEGMESQGKNMTWDGLHEEVFSNPQIQKITYLEGEHYLQWTQSQAIAELTDKFIQGVN